MMFLFASLVLASLVVVTLASHRRVKTTKGKKRRAGSLVDANNVEWPMPKKATMKVEKGMSCTVEFDRKEMGAGKKFAGGIKKTMSIEFTPEEMAQEIANGMEAMYADMAPDQTSFYPLDETVEEMLAIDEIDLDDMEEGFSKKVEFRGVVKAFWGCNVTWSKEGGKLSKTVECGAKGMESIGTKPPKQLNTDEESVVFLDVEQ